MSAGSSARSVNVFGTPGEKYINVFPRKSAINQGAKPKNPAQIGAGSAVAGTPTAGGKVQSVGTKTAELHDFRGQIAPSGEVDKVAAALRSCKEAAMEKEGFAGILRGGMALASKLPQTYRAARSVGGMGRAASAATAARSAARTGARATRKYYQSIDNAKGVGDEVASLLASNPATAAYNAAPAAGQAASRAFQAGQRFAKTPVGGLASRAINSRPAWYMGHMAREAGQGIGKNMSFMDAMSGNFAGMGLDAANQFMTGNESNFGTAGLLLGAFGPGMRRIGRRIPFLRNNSSRIGRIWGGVPLKEQLDSSGSMLPIMKMMGLKGALNTAAGYSLLGEAQQMMTANKTPGGINYSDPVGTANRAGAVNMQLLANKLGFRSAQEMDQAIQMYRQMMG